MIFYNYLFLIISALSIFNNLMKKKKIIYIFLLIVLIFLSTFRAENVGTDYINYENIFKQIMLGKLNFVDSKVEPIFFILCKFLSFFSSDPRIAIKCMSVITLTNIGYYTYHNSKNYNLSLLIFVGLCHYFVSFNIARQIMAFSIILLALHFLKHNKKIGSILLIFAFFSHYSTIIWFIIIYLSKMKLSKKKLYIIICLMPIALLVFSSLMPIIISYTNYSEYTSNIVGSRSVGYYIFIAFKIIIFVLYIFNFKISKSDEESNLIFFVMLFDIFISLSILLFPYMGRLIYTVEPYMMISIPYVINRMFRNKVRNNLCFSTIFALMGFIFINSLIDGNKMYGIVPYIFKI